jgi:hypothetical protein
MIRAWHFVGKTLRDGRPVPEDGEWLKCPDKLIMCASGLHASRQPFDALQYAPGSTLCLVDCAGELIEQSDKLVCAERRIVVRMDATELCGYFARMQALSAVHLWEAPDAVLDFLMTGDAAASADAYADAAARASAYAAAHAAAHAAARASADAAAYADAAYAREEFNKLVMECFEGAV